ncbi:MAG: hypothetical protein AAF249_13335 [Pseudomonadota bacterium]
MLKSMKPILLFLSAFAMVASATSASAQFGNLFNDARRGAEKADSGCGKGKKGDVARGALGGLLGGIGRRTARRSGVTRFVPVAQFEDTLTTEIACILDADEQKQAAEATIAATSFDPAPVRSVEEGDDETPVDTEALRGPPVGQSASWTSGTRDEVTGTSTVTAREETGDESDCIFVTDIIIVRGEETRAEKRMCRAPGSRRYAIVA